MEGSNTVLSAVQLARIYVQEARCSECGELAHEKARCKAFSAAVYIQTRWLKRHYHQKYFWHAKVVQDVAADRTLQQPLALAKEMAHLVQDDGQHPANNSGKDCGDCGSRWRGDLQKAVGVDWRRRDDRRFPPWESHGLAADGAGPGSEVSEYSFSS